MNAFRKICFVIMPFGIKDTGASPPAPGQVNFDALWKFAIAPALDKLGYRAVRADQDMGPLIIKEMLERLYYSDIVVADVSIANANAYYEVGIRHAARTDGCVLIAADWARPVFDLAQIRHVPYPNSVVTLDEAGAQPIVDLLVQAIPHWSTANTPMHETIAGYPKCEIDGARARQLAGELEAFESLRGEVATIASMPKDRRKALAGPLLATHPAMSITQAYVAVEMVKFIRDVVDDWESAHQFIESLPASLQSLPFMKEQHALALSKQGDHFKAITALKTLIGLAGDSSERQGLLGGRYKRLYNDSIKASKAERSYLNHAISHYEQGMKLDLNDYYPTCNLPALYRERDAEDDEDRATATANIAMAACERALKRNSSDEWCKPTLLGLAFAARNVAAARTLAEQVSTDNCAGWKIETTLSDLHRHLSQIPHGSLHSELSAIVQHLSSLRPS